MENNHQINLLKPKFWQIPNPSDEIIFRLPEKIAQVLDRLQFIVSEYKNVKFASSLAVEDMLITDLIARHNLPIAVFTLQTGKLNRETLNLLHLLPQNYPNLHLELYEPHSQEIENYTKNFGEFAFYESVDLRKKCCFIRKIEPLNRALIGADAWLTGQRREQSVTRNDLNFQEKDENRGIAKFNPIYDWSEQEVWAYILENQIIFNDLYLQGYPSIGCEPCSMPVKWGDDIRAGRWWWENRDSKECGLHK